MPTYTQIYDNNAHDPMCSTDRDQLFNDIYQHELHANPKYILQFKIIQIDDDGVINNITPDYDLWVENYEPSEAEQGLIPIPSEYKEC